MALVKPHGSSSTNYTSTWNFSYDVFLNFRGEDTRHGFIGNLYYALIQKGIKTFIDDEGLSKGDDISLALIKAIEGSRVSIVVFSQNYAFSRWCLDELIKILDCLKLRRQLVIPVFYKIHPSMVRHQTGPYEKALANYKKKMRDNMEKVNGWRSALYQAANLSGWHFESGYEFQIIQNIVEEISKRLKDPILLESQTSQAILQGLEFKNDVATKEYTEVAASAAPSKMANGKVEASKSTKKFLFFGYSSRQSETAAPSMVGNNKAGATIGDAKKSTVVSKLSKPSNAAATSTSKVGNGTAEATNGAAKKLVFFNQSYWQFDLEDMLTASAEVMSKGTFGTSYKAVLEDGTVLAVKRLRDVTNLEKEFKEKIEILGAMAHENLMPVMGYYFSKDEKLLFHDYMPMGSLSALLHERNRTPLNWKMRLRIALGAACGIEYLHAQGPNISHGNIRSSNILLTKSYEARVSDFGLVLLINPSSTPTRINGYRAPEVTDPRKISQKADVYSFGVLLLELLTGNAPTHFLRNEEGTDLPKWVNSIAREEWNAEVFDLELLRYQNAEEEMVQLLQLAIDCTAANIDKRPCMPDVTKWIKELKNNHVHQHQFSDDEEVIS